MSRKRHDRTDELDAESDEETDDETDDDSDIESGEQLDNDSNQEWNDDSQMGTSKREALSEKTAYTVLKSKNESNRKRGAKMTKR